MEWLDVDNNTIKLGDKVTCVTPWEAHPAVGTTGVVFELWRGGHIGVAWDGFSTGHNLVGYTGCSGWYCSPNTVRIIDIPLTSELEGLKEFITLERETSYLIEGGRVATITYFPTNNPLSKFLTERDRDTKEVLAAAMDSLEKVRAKLVEENKDILAMPPITWGDIQEGMCLFKRGDALVWRLPFSYAPRFITNNNDVYQIPEELANTLFRDCLLEISYTKAQTRTLLLRNDIDSYKRLYHYHSTFDYDCLGDYQILVCDNPQNVWKSRDEIEKLLECININSIGTHEPEGMPSASVLLQEGTKIEQLPGQWVNPLHRGVKVKVIGQPPDFPTECIGSIGMINSSRPGAVEVRFRFTHISFGYPHAIHRRCLTVIPIDNIEVVPPSTPCTQFFGHPVS